MNEPRTPPRLRQGGPRSATPTSASGDVGVTLTARPLPECPPARRVSTPNGDLAPDCAATRDRPSSPRRYDSENSPRQTHFIGWGSADYLTIGPVDCYTKRLKGTGFPDRSKERQAPGLVVSFYKTALRSAPWL